MKGRIEKLGPLVGKVLDGLGLQKRVEEYRVIEEWERIVGKVIAERAEPVQIARGRIVVQVNSSPWLMEMKMREREILEKIAEAVGNGVVREIRFVGK
jgi:predicted nucleic acid-binding Zn ribbon protein